MQPDIPTNPFVARLLGQKSCLRLRRADLYHPNDPWGLEGPFLVSADWVFGDGIIGRAPSFVQDHWKPL